MSKEKVCIFNPEVACIVVRKYTKKELKRICFYCSNNSQDWYEKHIEKAIRPLVKLLRNNGVDTICSCGHEMYCECKTHGNYYDEASGVFDLLVKNGYEHFKVEVIRGIDETGLSYNCLTIWLPKKDGKLSEFNLHKGSE